MFERNERISAVARRTAAAGGLVVSVVDEPTTKFAGLASGDLDVAGIAPTMAALAARDPSLRVLDYPILFTHGPRIQRHKPPFDDVRVRRAISLSIDRDRIVRAALAGYGRAAAGPVPPRESARARRSDRCATRALADSLLDAAGWRRGADGARRRAGTAVRVRAPHRRQRRQRARAAGPGRPRRARHSREHPSGRARLVSHRRRAQRRNRSTRSSPAFPATSRSPFSARCSSRARPAARSTTPAFTRRASTRCSRARAGRATDSERVAAWRACSASSTTTCPSRGSITRAGCRASRARLQNVVMDLRGEMVTLGAVAGRAGGTMTLLLVPARRSRRDGAASQRSARSRSPRRSPRISSRCSTRDIVLSRARRRCSRAQGGRCARDGTLLEFDPFEPHEHRCPRCGDGVSRRAARSLLDLLVSALARRARGARRSPRRARRRATDFARARRADPRRLRRCGMLSYPNVDNVLGPTRLFFSTYLESIWLLQICIATDLLRDARPALAGRVLRSHRRAEPRASSPSTTRADRIARCGTTPRSSPRRGARTTSGARSARCYGQSGIAAHLGTGLLRDGTWFEGENYHLFAHRGLWYGVTMAEQAGLELPAAARRRAFSAASPRRSLPRCRISRCRRAATRSTPSRSGSGASPSICELGAGAR